MNVPSDYYVYVLTDPRTSIPFYVGKGTKFRYKAHESEARTGNDSINKAKCDFIREIWESGHNIQYDLIACQDEDDAFSVEQELILKHGKRIDGGLLFNIQNGGKDTRKPKTSHKQVLVYDTNGILQHTFASAVKAAQFFECDSSVVSKRARECRPFRDVWVLSYKEITVDEIQEAQTSHRKAKRAVNQCSLDGTLLVTHSSTYEAARSVGLREDTIYCTIRDHLAGKRKSPAARGFLWSFAD